MASPTNPTASSIVSEGLKKAGESNPSVALTTRATDQWLEEIKNDILHRSKKLKRLMVTSYGVITQGKSRYANPTDYSSDLELTLLSGNSGNTAQGGSIGSITLSATETATNIIGLYIIIISGASQAAASQVISYDTATKVATVSPNFKTSPDSTSVYMIVTREIPLHQKGINQFTQFNQLSPGEPKWWFPMGDEDYGEFVLDKPPQVTYGARYRYYADITRLDLTSEQMSNLYRIWRNIFVQGITAKRFQDVDDTRSADEFLKYQRQLNNLVTSETYGTDLSGLTDYVQDYM